MNVDISSGIYAKPERRRGGGRRGSKYDYFLDKGQALEAGRGIAETFTEPEDATAFALGARARLGVRQRNGETLLSGLTLYVAEDGLNVVLGRPE